MPRPSPREQTAQSTTTCPREHGGSKNHTATHPCTHRRHSFQKRGSMRGFTEFTSRTHVQLKSRRATTNAPGA